MAKPLVFTMSLYISSESRLNIFFLLFSGCKENWTYDCCTSDNKCGVGEGDCDNDSECQLGLK